MMIKIQAGMTVDAGSLLSGFSWAKVGQQTPVTVAVDEPPTVNAPKTELTKKRSIAAIIDEFVDCNDSLEIHTIDNDRQLNLMVDADI